VYRDECLDVLDDPKAISFDACADNINNPTSCREYMFDVLGAVAAKYSLPKLEARGRCIGTGLHKVAHFVHIPLNTRYQHLQEEHSSFVRNDETVRVFRRYRFCLCAENNDLPGWITEKMANCLMAGAVPVYFGTALADKIFNAERFIRFGTSLRSMQEAAERVTYLERNRTAYQEVASKPALANGEETIAQFFSFKRAWGGGGLAQQIRAAAHQMLEDLQRKGARS
jgi:hypothetical protein